MFLQTFAYMVWLLFWICVAFLDLYNYVPKSTQAPKKTISTFYFDVFVISFFPSDVAVFSDPPIQSIGFILLTNLEVTSRSSYPSSHYFQPLHVQRFATRTIVEMHEGPENRVVSIEMRYSLGSLWIYLQSERRRASLQRALRSKTS